MFSNLSNFIPAALQQSFSAPFDRDKGLPQVHAHDYEQRESVSVEDDGKQILKKEKEKKGPNETFIIVRPPPSKSNHPLNLQVQLVPPNTKTPAGVSTRLSDEMERPTPSISISESSEAPLSRISSNRSDYSGYGSTTSFSSFSSNASSSRRTIIPLYSLQAHNVMTNVIVDAGTDAKIARFNKRGIEMVDLANLEPTEVWAGATKDMVLQPAPSSNDALPIPATKRTSLLLSGRPGTPDRSSTASGLEPKLDAMLAAGSASPQKRNFFNKIFNKKPKDLDLSVYSSLSKPLNTPPATPDRDRTPRKQPSLLQTSPLVLRDEPPPTPLAQLRPPVLGIQPALAAPPGQNPPIGRPSLYVWSVRRWTKTGDQSLLGKLSNLNPNAVAPVDVDVRFEWKRGKSKKKLIRKTREKDGGNRSRDTSVSRKTTPSASTASLHDTPRPPAGLTAEDKNLNRLSIISHQSGTTTGDGHEDDGDESDPEDSETPWTCTLKVRKEAQVIRVKVATLSPTPHHPKVVAMLKVPFPLPDIEIERVIMRKRQVAPNGSVPRHEPDPKAGIELTAEEIKDIICCTGMWVVVREGFGGVGKVSRKGDGWRIRA